MTTAINTPTKIKVIAIYVSVNSIATLSAILPSLPV
jgi:hypothetical protein